jgi:ubiquinone biosynthesis protein COQ4
MKGLSTSILQRFYLTIKSAGTALVDPYRGDMVATLGEVSGEVACIQIRERMKVHPIGRKILQERPTIDSQKLPLEVLLKLPVSTLGHQYALFMKNNGITADTRAPVQYISDEELAYVMLRYRQVHDFFHVLTDMPINVLGELGLKWFEAYQTGLPMTILASIFGPLRLNALERRYLVDHMIPWARKCAFSSVFLMNVYYERHMDKDMSAMQKELGIIPFNSK